MSEPVNAAVPSRTDQGNITKFLITSNKNKKKRDITGSIVDLYYQESIFDTSVRLQISVSDTGYKEIDKKNKKWVITRNLMASDSRTSAW